MLVIGYDARGERETAVNGEHVLLIGPPGSGKTQGFLVPSIVTHPGPVLATSSKGDIALTTVARRRRVGRTLSFSPGAETVPGTTPVFWDPVRGCDNYDEALLRADAMVRTVQALNGSGADDAFWYAMASRLLAALLHAAAIERLGGGGGDGVLAVSRWVSSGDLDDPIAILAAAHAGSAQLIVAGIDAQEGRLRDSVLMTTAQALRVFDSPSVQCAMDSYEAFDAQTFVAGRDTLYVVAPLEQQEMLASLVVGLIDDVTRAAMAMSAGEEHLERQARRSVVFALDEVANIAPLPNLPRIASAGGGQGCHVMAVLQDLSQAKQRWKDAADGFVTMFHHKILLPGVMHQPTLEAFERVLPHSGGGLGAGSVAEWSASRIAGMPLGRALRVSGARPVETAVHFPLLPKRN